MDENSKVQEASCSALSKITYENPELVEQYIFDIMDVIKHVYEHYQKKSLTNLYDVIASLSSISFLCCFGVGFLTGCIATTSTMQVWCVSNSFLIEVSNKLLLSKLLSYSTQ